MKSVYLSPPKPTTSPRCQAWFLAWLLTLCAVQIGPALLDWRF